MDGKTPMEAWLTGLLDMRPDGQGLDAEALESGRSKLLRCDLSEDSHPAEALLEDLPPERSYDYILTNPPFHLSDWCEVGGEDRRGPWPYGPPPRKNADFAWLQRILMRLSPGGRAVTLLPNGSLTTRTRAERRIRAGMLRDGWVEAILALPAGLFRGTKVPCCAWLLHRSPGRKTVLFVDANSMNGTDQADCRRILELLRRYRDGAALEATDWYAAASLEAIEKTGYLLSPKLYTRPKPLSLPPLSQLSDRFDACASALCRQLPPPLREAIKGWVGKSVPDRWRETSVSEAYQLFGGVQADQAAFGQGTPMADVKTVIDHWFLPDALPARVAQPAEKLLPYTIRCGDVLLNRSSENLAALACCSVALRDQAAVYGAYLIRLRPFQADWADPGFLAAYFRSGVYRREVARLTYGRTTRWNINQAQLSKVRLYCPDLPWQREMGALMQEICAFCRTCRDPALEAQFHRLVAAWIEKFITYPISQFQKERDPK